MPTSTPAPHNLTRRRALSIAGATSVGAAALLAANGQSAEAALVGQASFAPPPTGGDDTALLTKAITTGQVLGPATYRCYKPIDSPRNIVLGIPGATTIEVYAEALLSSSSAWTTMHWSGVNANGDTSQCRNIIRNTYSGPNVGPVKHVADAHLQGHSRAAISCNQSDGPYVMCERVQFTGSSFATSSSLALRGGTDGCRLRDCHHFVYRYGVVAEQGGCHLSVEDNEFIHYGQPSGGDRADIWIIPAPTWVNAGQGFRVTGSKFGNENLDARDYRIVIADRGASLGGTARYPGDWALSTAPSQGWMSLGTVRDNDFSGGPEGLRSPITSYTPNVYGYTIVDNPISGTHPRYMLEFAAGAPSNQTNTRIRLQTLPNSVIAPCSHPSVVLVD